MAMLLRGSLRGGSRIVIDSEAGPAWICGDATQIRQLLMNLLSNASDALDDSSGTIAVRIGTRFATREELAEGSFGADLEAGDYVVVEVRDDGCGMDEATRERIFEPFFTTKFEGRGLGLAAAMGIVRGHAGALRFSSEPGKGTVFRVFLPRAAAPPGDAALTSGRPNVVHGGAGGVVLVVDDEAGVRRVAARMLERSGFQVVEAESGEEALALFLERKGAVHSALVDLTMPGWDGARFARELRRAGAAIPIVFMSGHSEQDAALRAEGDAGFYFLKKPFRLEELCECFGRLLSHG
jgi:CheY-like chemotaxis protein